MIKRPAPGDTEQDILRMQSDFLNEQFKNAGFEPAAKVVKVEAAKAREPSNFAKKRAAMRLNRAAEQALADDPLMPPQPSAAEPADGVAPAANYLPIIGKIVERSTLGLSGHERTAGDEAFPKPERLQRSQIAEGSSSRSLFAMSRSAAQTKPAEVAEPMDSVAMDASSSKEADFGDKSYITNSKLSAEIHAENVKQLSQMNEAQLMEQRNQLMEEMDPDLIKWLQSIRRQRSQQPSTSSASAPSSSTLGTIHENPPPVPSPSHKPPAIDSPATLEILNDPQYTQWPNFNVIEHEKLEWMRDIQNRIPAPKEGETYEARFDWKGVLQPFTLAATGDDAADSSRELFLHGDDAQRPGYTLQELFRLARSKVQQQRIAAIGAIAGILSLYNQGFYDAVLEVPISKCFFLLRFALDENIPGIVEASSKALATLLHNDADETLLDFTRDCSADSREPVYMVRAPTATTATSAADKEAEEVERKFAQMHLDRQGRRKPMMQTSVEATAEADDEEDGGETKNRESLNDFHLAEIDLVECLLRTNIVKRINYVLFTLCPDNSTVTSCLRILIRLARSGAEVVATLFADDLLRQICRHFLPAYDGDARDSRRYFGQPQHLAVKLMRLVASYGSDWCDRLLEWRLFEVVKSYVFVRGDLKMDLIKLQIEAFGLAKVIVLSHKNSVLYNELAPAMLYMLNWCYQFLQFTRTGHLIFRQHAAALLNLVSSVGTNTEPALHALITEQLTLCCCKWFSQATAADGLTEFSQPMLLATCLHACQHLAGDTVHRFYSGYLLPFLGSSTFAALCAQLSRQSPLLRRISLRPNAHEALPHLNSVVIDADTAAPDYIIGKHYSAHLCTNLLRLLLSLSGAQHHRLAESLLATLWSQSSFAVYLQLLANRPWNTAMRCNWFVRNEQQLLGLLLQSQRLRAAHLDTNRSRQIAFNLVTHLSEDQMDDVIALLDAVLFAGDDARLAACRRIYLERCFEHCSGEDDGGVGLMVLNYREAALRPNWPCAPLLRLLRQVQEPSTAVAVAGSSAQDAESIAGTLFYIDWLLAAGVAPFLQPTEHLMLLMIAYLDPGSSFLEPQQNRLLAETVRRFSAAHRETHFEFESTTLEGGTSFENLYLLLVDQFAATSYGDAMFGALVMVPLAQKYAVRWRQLVWSEHLAVMRFVQTEAGDLLGGGLREYLVPAERDVTQLKYYHQALQSMRFAEGAVAGRIAAHHLREMRQRRMRAEMGEAEALEMAENAKIA